jgi:hypothetical protein
VNAYVVSELTGIFDHELELQGVKSCLTEPATKKAQKLIPYYLETQKFKFTARKHELDKITAMQEFISKLPDDHGERRKFGIVLQMVPHETDEYKRDKSVADQKAKQAELRKRKQDERAAKNELLKQERLAKQKSILEALNAADPRAPAPAPAPEAPAGRKRRAPTDDEVKEAIMEFVSNDLPKLPIRNQSMRPTEICRRDLTDGVDDSHDDSSDHLRPIKFYEKISIEGNFVDISYSSAGVLFVSGVKKRFHNIVSVLNMVDEKNPIMIQDLFSKAEAEINSGGGKAPIQAMQTMVALFMDASGDVNEERQADSDWPKVANLKCVSCLCFQENFSKDMNMLSCTFFNKSVNHIVILTAFGLLANEDRSFGGMTSGSIWEEINSELKGSQRIPEGVASQFRLLKVVTSEVAKQYHTGNVNQKENVYNPFVENIICEIPMGQEPSKKAKSTMNS